MSLAKDSFLLLLLTTAFLAPIASLAPSYKKPFYDFLKTTSKALMWTAGGGVVLVVLGGGVLVTEEIMRRWSKRNGGLPRPPPPTPPTGGNEVAPQPMDRERVSLMAEAKKVVENKLARRRANRARLAGGGGEEVEMDEL